MIRIECKCLCSSTPAPELSDVPKWTLDESFQRSHNINLFCKHLIKEHNSECLLSYIEFKQYQLYVINQIYKSDVELMCMALKMRSELEVKNRKFKFKTHKKCIVGEHAIEWLMNKINRCSRLQAFELFCDFISNGLILCCSTNDRTPSHSLQFQKNRRGSVEKKEQSLYKFVWDVVDVDDIQTPFADIVPMSYIVRSSKYNMEQKAYQLYRKYVETDSDLEINVSNQIKKMFGKYVDDLEKTLENISALRILELFETLRLEMLTYLQFSFGRMEPLYKNLSVKERRILGIRLPSTVKRFHTLQNIEFDRIAQSPKTSNIGIFIEMQAEGQRLGRCSISENRPQSECVQFSRRHRTSTGSCTASINAKLDEVLANTMT